MLRKRIARYERGVERLNSATKQEGFSGLKGLKTCTTLEKKKIKSNCVDAKSPQKLRLSLGFTLGLMRSLGTGM